MVKDQKTRINIRKTFIIRTQNKGRLLMKNFKKKKRLIILCLALLIMCIPIKYNYKDGGTVSYRAILYSYTKYHRLEDDDRYFTGTKLLIFPFNFLK